jgi:Transposase and inactivated derivatives
MKAYTLDLRERIVEFVRSGGAKTEAAARFRVSRKTVYRYLAADGAGSLAPKASWGGWRKLDPEAVRREVGRNGDATLGELAGALGVHLTTVHYRLRKMKVTLKKTRTVP